MNAVRRRGQSPETLLTNIKTLHFLKELNCVFKLDINLNVVHFKFNFLAREYIISFDTSIRCFFSQYDFEIIIILYFKLAFY